MNIKLSLITAPASEPVTLTEAKSHLRIDDSSEDTYITSLISAARQMVENFTRRAFITQTWAMCLKQAPDSNEIELPKAPLQSITHIKAHNDDGTENTLISTAYHVGVYGGLTPDYGKVTLKSGYAWPDGNRTSDLMEIQFVAGYGDASSVPTSIKNAILMVIGHLYENRGDCDENKLPQAVQYILMPFKMMRL